MRYAVTGGTGFVGGRLVDALLAAGNEVVALARGTGRTLGGGSDRVSIIAGDLFDSKALDALCEGVDALFHVAGWYKLGDRHPDQGRLINVEGTRNVLSAAQRANVPKVVYTSTLAVNSDTHGRIVDETYRFDGKHLSVYDATKAAAHRVAEQFADDGLPIVTVMPGLVYGPGDTSLTGQLMQDVIAGRRVMVPAGGGVCWAHVDDIAAGHMLAATSGVAGTSYMLAGPAAPLIDGLRRLATMAGRRQPTALPRSMVSATAVATGIIGRLAPVPAAYSAESLRAALATYYGDPGRAMSELGWSCRDLDTGLSELVTAASARR